MKKVYHINYAIGLLLIIFGCFIGCEKSKVQPKRNNYKFAKVAGIGLDSDTTWSTTAIIRR